VKLVQRTSGNIPATYQASATTKNNNIYIYTILLLTASNSIFLILNLSLWLATMGRIDSIATFSPDNPTVKKKEIVGK